MPEQPPAKKLGLGVLGLGEGRSIISAGVHSPRWNVVTLCDLSEPLGRERCAEFNLSPRCYTSSYEALLNNPAVDVVGIYTPDHLHADHVIQALRAGKHVICTKPFIDNLARAAEVLTVWRQSGKQVFIGQSSRFFAPFRRQREHFETGKFGDLVTVETYYNADHRWFLKKPWAKLDSFNWLYNGISHPADLIRWYLPDITEVMGYSHLSKNGRELGLKQPDTYHFVLRTKRGLIGRVSGTYSSPVVPIQRDSNMSCILRASEGASQGDYYDLRYAWKIGDHSVVETFEDHDAHYFRFEGHSHHAGEYQNYIEYFARSLSEGFTAKPDVPEAIVTVALMQAMEESCRTGQPVKVKDLLARHGLDKLSEAP